VTTRRELLLSPAALPLLAAQAEPWTPEWDRALLEGALKRYDARFDPSESLIALSLGGDYQYHTTLRAQTAHPTRESLEYALLLLERGAPEDAKRASAILARVLPLQVTDPASKWYGLWGWYAEEPPEKMQPADWNWADFNGALLLLIHHRHARKLGPAARALRDAIRHAASSVRKRDVAMSYTNIAVKGTFVTKAAAELLGDKDLNRYANARLRRLLAELDKTGSFAEYNSPTYALVSAINCARFRLLVRDPAALAQMKRFEDRLWLHWARHWHGPTRQFAGPMSRCYSNVMPPPAWLQKALGGKLSFVTLDQLRSGETREYGELSFLPFRCPPEAEKAFLAPLEKPRLHRELFIAGDRPPVQGTTYLASDYSLGSVNRGDFWNQRRPLLAHWTGGPGQPAASLQVRVLKDGYDFASAGFYSVQKDRSLIACINFFTPGGDRHPSLDPIPNGEFALKRLAVEWQVRNAVTEPITWGGARRFRFSFGAVHAWCQLRGASFPYLVPRLGAFQVNNDYTAYLTLLDRSQPTSLRWADIPGAYILFTLWMGNEALGLNERREEIDSFPFSLEEDSEKGLIHAKWQSPDGPLELTASTRIQSRALQDAAFGDRIDGQPVPLVRLA
jgi:hypothetical protein